MRVGLCQIDPTVGDISGNAQLILDAYRHAVAAGADLVVLPELALCGYPPEDLLLRQDFLAACERELSALARAIDVPCFVGFPQLDGDVYNACAVIADGAIQAVYRKQFLPNYGVFDEQRYFRPATDPLVVEIDGVTVGITICEDIWQPGAPASAEAAAGAEVIVNLSASPYHAGKADSRERMLLTRAVDNLAAVVFCNMVGGQDELVFDGSSCVIDADGVVLARAAQFQQQILLCDVPTEDISSRRLRDARHRAYAEAHPHEMAAVSRVRVAPASLRAVQSSASPDSRPDPQAQWDLVDTVVVDRLDPLDEMYAALVLGLRDYCEKNGFPGAALGISGGIDSALVLAIACDALGADRVTAVSMPSRHSSSGTRSDAEAIATNFGVQYHEIPIEPALDGFLASFDAAGLADRVTGLAAENLQARARGVILMTLSNAEGQIVLTTGNKSEMSTGYATLYGDMAGGFAPIKDVPKTLVFDLCRWYNARAGREMIPQSIIDRPPSAELRPDQRDDDSLPPYEVLDPILDAYIVDDEGRERILAAGHSPEWVDEAIRLVDRSEYKRRQAAPGTKITPKSFGRDRRLPITNRYRPHAGTSVSSATTEEGHHE